MIVIHMPERLKGKVLFQLRDFLMAQHHKHLIGRRLRIERIALFLRRLCDALRLCDRVPRHVEPESVFEISVKLHAKQKALCEHAAALLDHVAEMRLERVVCNHDRLAE